MTVGSASFGVLGYWDVWENNVGVQGPGLTLAGCASYCAGLSTCVTATLDGNGNCWAKNGLSNAYGASTSHLFLIPSGKRAPDPASGGFGVFSVKG